MAPPTSTTLLQVERGMAERYVAKLKINIAEALEDETKVGTTRAFAEPLLQKVGSFETAHAQIMSKITDSEQLEELYQQHEIFLEDVAFVKDKLSLPPFKVPATAPITDQSNTLNDGFNTTRTSTHTGMFTRLPKLDMPIFNGNLAEWSSYYDMFRSSIDENESLLPVHRFQYLKSTLKGDPLTLIKNLPLTDANYQIAIQLLRERYEHKRLILTHHIEAILNLPSLASMSHDKVSPFISSINEHVEALRAQGEPVEDWSPVLAVILSNKLDTSIRSKFERRLDRNHLPSLEMLLTFLKELLSSQQWQTMSQRASKVSSVSKPTTVKRPLKPKTESFVTTTNSYSCMCCQQAHSIYRCQKFRELSVDNRWNVARKHRACYNCLQTSHQVNGCQSKVTCTKCFKRHHTLLHSDKSPTGDQTLKQPISKSAESSAGADNREPTPSTSNNHAISPGTSSVVLLGTVQLLVASKNNQWHTIRALLDSGSESTFLTENCRQKLGLPLFPTNTIVSGLSNVEINAVKGTSRCKFRPMSAKQPVLQTKVIVVSQLTSDLPKQHIPLNQFREFRSRKLADPDFNTPGPIDCLIGADLFPQTITGNMSGSKHKARAMETIFGWVIIGTTSVPRNQFVDVHHARLHEPLTNVIQRFWELEEIPNLRPHSQDDQRAEEMFSSQHFRTPEGRYVVPLLFNEFPPAIGNSYAPAIACYRSLRRRLQANPSLKGRYLEFLKDYHDQEHMTRIPSGQLDTRDGYYMPHHCVLKESSSTTKLRVVFNASKETSLGNSLNKELLTGPSLNHDLTTIILRARFHEVLMTADIKQMYRQILVLPEQRPYQRILWDFLLSDQPEVFQLNTVTYGTGSAPFLATRTLHQLAADEGADFPQAAQALIEDTYVDDFITGADTLKAALDLRTQLVGLLARGGLELRKWTSNSLDLLASIPEADREPTLLNFLPGEDASVKILGLVWNPTTDNFSYNINPIHVNCTKRQILSEIAHIFDPLGWLTPTTFVAKQLMQELWKLGVDWDDEPPQSIQTRWSEYRTQLPSLKEVAIPRKIGCRNTPTIVAGFCDASELGYAAVVYLHWQDDAGSFKTALMMAKSRVAPLKSVSIPRLELCAAMLLSRLIAHVKGTLRNHPSKIYAWSDSQVTLAWIRSPAYRWKTFVSNRVAEIQRNLPSEAWHHVTSQDNPADCASRGVFPANMSLHNLWWHGPKWLRQPTSKWPLKSDNACMISCDQVLTEERTITTMVAQVEEQETLLDRYSTLDKVLRTTAWCYRFSNNCRNRAKRQTTHLSASETDHALMQWVRTTQQQTFSEEMQRLNANKLCGAHLQRLSPFLDDEGVLRVGGRLTNANIAYEQKHPILLPSNHRLTDLLVTQYHLRYLHPSPRTLQSILGQRFWILSARRVVRRITSKCVRCFRCKPTNQNPIMGDLPSERVSPLKPFATSGVDYGGPFHITPYKMRGCKSVKAYLCLFICFSTKAVHLELVSELTTSAFLLALQRFLARRGRCSRLHSDSGTNFVGARRYFSQLQKFVTSSGFNDHLANKLAAEGIDWSLNPPSAPHFGGLWESAIKSVKFHLARVIGDQILTYEEFYTILCRIESILNSRPVGPLSDDPNDTQALTPNHFLTLEAATGLPEQDLLETAENRMTRWQLVQRVVQDFWRRWHHEYLNSLQVRGKWLKQSKPIKEGELVIIKDDCLPPLQWRLARVTKVFPGKDDVVRVAEVKTSTSVLVRPVVKLFPLPT